MMKVGYSLDDQLSVEWEALPGVEVLIEETFPPTVRVPDISIVQPHLVIEGTRRLVGRDLAIAVEVVAPGSRLMDTVTKVAQYARAGIPNYWLFDVDGPVSVLAYELDGASYTLTASITGGLFTTTSPSPITIDLDALVRR
jgi:Uma2 family endonuclease